MNKDMMDLVSKIKSIRSSGNYEYLETDYSNDVLTSLKKMNAMIVDYETNDKHVAIEYGNTSRANKNLVLDIKMAFERFQALQKLNIRGGLKITDAEISFFDDYNKNIKKQMQQVAATVRDKIAAK